MDARQRGLGALLTAIGFGALIAASWIPCQSPRAVLHQLSRVLASGDLETLLGQACLGAAGQTADAIVNEGTRFYDEHIAIYEAQRALGEQQIEAALTRVSNIERRMEQAGQEAFDELETSEKWRVWVGQDKDAWLFAVGRNALDPEEQAIVTTAAVLDDASVRDATERRIGCAEEGEDAVAVLAQVALGTLDAEDRDVARVLSRCDRVGATRLRSIERSIDRERRRADTGRRRPSDDRAPMAQPNEAEERRRLGRQRVGSTDAAFYDTHRPWRQLGPNERRALAFELGWPQLSAAQRAKLGSVSYDDFVAARGAFINREGQRLLRDALRQGFGECTLRVERITPVPRTAGGMFGTWTVVARHDWERVNRRFRLASPDQPFGDDYPLAASDPVPAEALRFASEREVSIADAADHDLLRHDYRAVEQQCEGYRSDSLVYHRGRWTAEPLLTSFERNPIEVD